MYYYIKNAQGVSATLTTEGTNTVMRVYDQNDEIIQKEVMVGYTKSEMKRKARQYVPNHSVVANKK